ncbi:MAG: carbon-nitrogen hydrolase family protein [Cyclobacteriaceae bacterium]
MKASQVTVGIVQSGPVYLDLTKSLEKAEQLAKEAADKGVELLVFGESWLSGYPAWLDHVPKAALWDYEPTKKVFANTWQNSIAIPGPDLDRLSNLAQQHQLTLGIGINEKVEKGKGNGTIYNSLIMISHEGALINHHRKLMPTFTEKMVYGLGDGQGLKAVDTNSGRIGGLICWEHWMPLTRQALHNSGEQIHIALWPQVHEMLQIASRHYAFEGRCFVISVGQVMRVSELPDAFDLPIDLADHPDRLLLNGGSSIIGPNGQYIMDPQYGKDELLVQTIDLDQTLRERMTLDVSGHYARPDVFDFSVIKKENGNR